MAKKKVFLWRFDMADEGRACGIFLDSRVCMTDPTKIEIKWKCDGGFSRGKWLPPIPKNALITIDNRVMPGLGQNEIKILTTSDGQGHSPVLDFLESEAGLMAHKISQLEDEKESALASLSIESSMRSNTEQEVIEKATETTQKMLNLRKSSAPRPGRRFNDMEMID